MGAGGQALCIKMRMLLLAQLISAAVGYDAIRFRREADANAGGYLEEGSENYVDAGTNVINAVNDGDIAAVVKTTAEGPEYTTESADPPQLELSNQLRKLLLNSGKDRSIENIGKSRHQAGESNSRDKSRSYGGSSSFGRSSSGFSGSSSSFGRSSGSSKSFSSFGGASGSSRLGSSSSSYKGAGTRDYVSSYVGERGSSRKNLVSSSHGVIGSDGRSSYSSVTYK